MSLDRASSSEAGISLIIPAYNEEARLGRTLDAYLPVLEATKGKFEVLVVMDGQDGTPNVVAAYSGRGVRGYHSSVKLGKGGAIMLGFQQARFNVVGYTDADGSLSPTDLGKLISSIPHYDCAIGSRWLPGSHWNVPEPLAKRIASRGFNLLVRGLLAIPLSDTQCGAKFYTADLIRKISREVTVTNWTIDVGLLYHARKVGARIVEVPVTWTDDSRTQFRLGKMIPFMLITVLGIRAMNLKWSKFIPRKLITAFQRRFGNA